MKAKIIALSVTSCLLFSSCATIVSGSRQEFNITSNPSQANVYVNGNSIGKTPIVTKLERKDKNQVVKITLDGYKDTEIKLTRKTNGWVWGNILFGGLIGLIVDASDGAMYKLTPDQINAELAKGVVINEKSKGVYIGITLEANADWEKIGNLEMK
jgi:hypothetical protein